MANVRGEATLSPLMKCDSCEEKATVFYTQVTDGKLKKFVLCESCAEAKGITNPNGLLMAEEILKPFIIGGPESEGGAKKGKTECSSCGFTMSDLQKIGRLGCPDCYDAFAPEIGQRLSVLHQGTVHTGAVPAGMAQKLQIHKRLGELGELLEAAVAEERYEEAAKIRDDLENLKSGKELPTS